MANDEITMRNEGTATRFRVEAYNDREWAILPPIDDNEQEITLQELAGTDRNLDAILNANPIPSKKEILREACRELVDSAYQNLLQKHGYGQFFREDYKGIEEEEQKYRSALQESSKALKETFKELRDNAEDAATKRMFDNYYRTAHLQLKNKTARAEYKEELRLLNVLNATKGEREVLANAIDTDEKALYFNILFSDRVAEIVKESKEATASKSQLEDRVYALADAMRPAGIKQERESQYHETAKSVVEIVGDELTQAQLQKREREQQIREAASIALGCEYARVPAFERKYGAKKKQSETSEGFYVSLSEESRATAFYNRIEAIATANKGKRRNELKREAYKLLSEQEQNGTTVDVMEAYKAHVRYVLDNADTKENQANPTYASPEKRGEILGKGPRTPVRLREGAVEENYETREQAEDAGVITYTNGKPQPVVRAPQRNDVDDNRDHDLVYVQGMLAEVKAQGTARREAKAIARREREARVAAMNLDDAFFENFDNKCPPRYDEGPSDLDDRTNEASQELERRVKRSYIWDRVVGGVQAGFLGVALGAFVASIGYLAQISNDAYHTFKNSFGEQQEQVEVVGKEYQPTETIDQKVTVDAAKKVRAEKQHTLITAQAPRTNYSPTKERSLDIKEGNYSREDRTIEVKPITVDYVVIPDVEIKVEPRPTDDSYRIGAEARVKERTQMDQGSTFSEYKVKPHQVTYSLGTELPPFPVYKPLDLRVDSQSLDVPVDYSGTLPQRTAPDKIVLFTF